MADAKVEAKQTVYLSLHIDHDLGYQGWSKCFASRDLLIADYKKSLAEMNGMPLLFFRMLCADLYLGVCVCV
jgi:hypothetical protein